MRNTSKTYQLVLTALFAAITALVTVIIRIPIPNGQGFLNFGDGILMVSGLILGPTVGMATGAIGSALAYVFAGYAIYAPFTFVVKGVEGWLAGFLFDNFKNKWIVTIIAGLVMAGGYFLTDWFLYGMAAAIVSLPLNIGQGLFGALVAGILYRPLKNIIHTEARIN